MKCPFCGEVFFSPNGLGIKCPSCGKIFDRPTNIIRENKLLKKVKITEGVGILRPYGTSYQYTSWAIHPNELEPSPIDARAWNKWFLKAILPADIIPEKSPRGKPIKYKITVEIEEA